MIRTAESVTEGHPDKLCDKMVGKGLNTARDLLLPLGIHPKVALECSVKGDARGGMMFLFGEAPEILPYEELKIDVLNDIGYTDPLCGFSYNSRLITNISEQSEEINHAVNGSKIGAGDQGSMIGFAIAGDGPEYMPMPIMIAHALTNRLTELRKSGELPYLRPDGKSQIGVAYYNGHPIGIKHVTLAASHATDVDIVRVRQDLRRLAIEPVLDAFNFGIEEDTEVIINGAGPWTKYGPLADSGTTGRKIIIDSLGIGFPHGGGNFNGKDWTKVDMSGAVAARYVARTLVQNGLARQVLIEVCYTIGRPHPNSIRVEAKGAKVPMRELEKRANQILDFSVGAIIDQLHLPEQDYYRAAAGGWFGRPEFSWEQVPSL